MLRLYFSYYKRLFPINLLTSGLFSVLNMEFYFRTFGLLFMTLGFILSLMYQEFAYKQEYYFYRNRGISKISLIATTFGVDAAIGITIMVIGCYGSFA